MITKHKISIALAACLLLAQSHVMHGWDYGRAIGGALEASMEFNKAIPDMIGKSIEETSKAFITTIALTLGGIAGGYLLYDAVADHAATLRWQRIQDQRETYVKNTLNITQDLQLKLTQEEAQKIAEEKFPSNGRVATPVSRRMLKGGIAAGVLAAIAWKASSLYRKYS